MEDFVDVRAKVTMSEPYEWVERQVDGASWLVRSDYQEPFLAVCHRGWRGGEVLRALPNRQVLRCEGQPPLVIKLFQHRSLTAMLKVLLQGTPAVREWRKIHQALQRGLPTAKPLAVGRTPGIMPRESVLITELLKEAVPVDVYLFGPSRSHGSERRRAIQEVAALIRKAHDAGWRQRDFHLGNILIVPETTRRAIFLIDFQRADFLSRPEDKTRWRDLAVLHGGSIAGSRAHRLRFLKGYLSVAPPISVDLRTLAAQLERRGLRHRFNLWQRRAKRCLAVNREFVRIRPIGFRGAARRADWTPDFEGLLKIPSAGTQSGEIVKNSRTTTVAALKIADRKIYLKRYNYQGWTYALKDLFRRARARRVWVAANSCVMRDLSVAPPLAYLERRRFGILLESYLVTEAVHGEKLTSWLACHESDFRHRRALIRALARYVGRMHERLVQNRDLKPDNLIVAQEQPNSYAVLMVDFDGVRIGPVSWRARVKNLTRLERGFSDSTAVTRSDRLRFLRTYLGPQFEDQWKKYWRRIARQADVD